MDVQQITYRLWTRCRDVAAALIAACWPGRDYDEVVAWLAVRAPSAQNAIVFGTLACLFGLSVVAAQFGLLGLCVFWLAVIWIIR